MLDDFGGGRAAIRTVAVRQDRQGQGHGRALAQLVEAFARTQGVAQLCVNANREATGYYAALGFSQQVWSEQELAEMRALRASPMPVQMAKVL